MEFQHVKPGKGGAFVRSKLRQVRSGKIVDHTFRAGEKVQTARIERPPTPVSVSGRPGSSYDEYADLRTVFVAGGSRGGTGFPYRGDHRGYSVSCRGRGAAQRRIARKVDLAVVDTDPGVRGDTATGGTKPAIMESGAVVLVPLFIDEGMSLPSTRRPANT